MTRTESGLAAYAGCLDGEVLLARYVVPKGEPHWTLPGGKVEHGEDPFDTVIREFAEETGCHAVVERLLGTTSAFSTRFGLLAANSDPSRTARPRNLRGSASATWPGCPGRSR